MAQAGARSISRRRSRIGCRRPHPRHKPRPPTQAPTKQPRSRRYRPRSAASSPAAHRRPTSSRHWRRTLHRPSRTPSAIPRRRMQRCKRCLRRRWPHPATGTTAARRSPTGCARWRNAICRSRKRRRGSPVNPQGSRHESRETFWTLNERKTSRPATEQTPVPPPCPAMLHPRPARRPIRSCPTAAS